MASKDINEIRERLIVALDFDSEKKALNMVQQLRGKVGLFKIGNQLFTAYGPYLVKKIISQGEKVFLDLKFHDIPNTVSSAAVEAAKLGITMLNIHAIGGFEMMQQTAAAVSQLCKEEKLNRPIILAVTVLTSLNQSMLIELGIKDTLIKQVIKLASLAKKAGLEGVVCSSKEVGPLRQNLGKDFVLVTPGIRPSWAGTDDQRRVNTPAQALANGADYLVIGRPIIRAKDPEEAVDKIIAEIRDSQ